VDLKGDLIVEALQEPGQLIIRLLDHGRTYDPDQVPKPDLEDPLKQQSGGWGVFLGKTGVDQFDYTSTDSGNVHRFVVRLPAEIAADDHLRL
jgi:anti-sigma regulatory factor (Ser/Thr protein kinase)